MAGGEADHPFPSYADVENTGYYNLLFDAASVE
jgi:hypothetical protein